MSDTVYREMKLRTFPYPDSLIATTTSKQIARSRPGDTFTFGLVAFKYANAFPFAWRLSVVFVLPLTLPDTNICIEGCRSKRRPGR